MQGVCCQRRKRLPVRRSANNTITSRGSNGETVNGERADGVDGETVHGGSGGDVSSPILEMSHLSKTFQRGTAAHKVVDDVTLNVYPKELFALLGHNGANTAHTHQFHTPHTHV